MARRRILVRDVAEIMEHWQAGRSIRAIARSLGADRDTIRRYVRAAGGQGYHPGPGGGPEQGWKAWVTQTFPGLSEQGRQMPTWIELERFREDIIVGLRETNGKTVWQRLRDNKGLTCSYNSFLRYVRWKVPDAGKPARITVRRDDPPPGEEAQIDFGYLGLWEGPLTGKRYRLWAFAMVLAHSRHLFACVVHRMDRVTWVQSHVAGFQFWGGVPARLVPDNLGSGVIKADLYDPKFNRSYEELARHYGCLIDPARAGKPRDKPRIERMVSYIRDSFWKGRTFLSFEEINQALREWCLKVAGMRIHGTTRQRPLETFLAVEKPVLKPLPRDQFEIATWYQAKVGDDCHVYAASGGYSVPYQYRGKRLDIRISSTLAQCFLDHELIKTHPRAGKGKRSTDWNDYPPEKGAFFSRTPDWCRNKARKMGHAVSEVIEVLLADHLLHHLRQVHGILRLGEKYGERRLDAACRRALDFGDPAYRTIKSILEKGLDQEVAVITGLPIAGAFLRGPQDLFASIAEEGKEAFYAQSPSPAE